MTSEKKPLRIAVLFEDVQMTDLAGLDILGNLSTASVQFASQINPQFASFLPLSTPMEFLYLSSTLESTIMTPSVRVVPTHTYDSAPRDLDMIVIAGPDPRKIPEASLKFLREAVQKTRVVLTTCTGAMWFAASGALDRKKATTNRVFLPLATKMFPNVEWQDQRWVVDKGHFEGAEIWTAGGAGCGIHMFVEYARKNFDKRIVDLSLTGLDFFPEGETGQFYEGPVKVEIPVPASLP
ncbi:DJ-1/PfpI family protein [Zopfia rhizophila CBS 207.26]|uniref:DJ-1/PfpI family protein n=1 Tax=Zopfia rhizophila CBS 207.26 TaxID=1314779 RepID=A0A6A6EJV9_9PEZI|nr:DJ-1/PfpI family protein [Zopfia rhizophila CBS 207.26]